MKHLLCIFAVMTSVLGAQEEGAKPLTLQECIERAVQNNPALIASRARVAGAEARDREARSALLPQLRLSGRAAQLSSVPEGFIELPVIGRRTIFPVFTHSYSARLSLQQPVFTGFRLARNVDIARAHLSAANEELTRDDAELRLSVTTAYWNLHRAMQLEKVMIQSVAQLDERLREVRNFARQGLATEGDVLKIQAQRSDVQLKKVEAESARRLAAMALNNLIGLPLETPVVPSDEPPMPPPGVRDDDLTSLIRKAKQQRPELRALTLRESASRAGIDAARGGWYPQVMVSAGYDVARPNPRIIPPADRWEASWDVGISLQWTIWDWWATSAQTAQAEATLTQTRAMKAQLEDAVSLEVAQQYFKVREAREKLGVAEDGLAQALESHRISLEKFKQGLVTNTDMLDAETALLQARVSHVQARLDYAIATARLRRAVGE